MDLGEERRAVLSQMREDVAGSPPRFGIDCCAPVRRWWPKPERVIGQVECDATVAAAKRLYSGPRDFPSCHQRVEHCRLIVRDPRRENFRFKNRCRNRRTLELLDCVEQRFEATTVVDLYRGNDVLIPAGSVMRGVVSSVTKAGRIERKGSLTVAFDRVTVNGRAYPIRGTVTQALESEGIKGEAEKIGIGAGAGAIIGAIIGGAKGALAGILIGGGGTIAATEGKEVELPQGSVLRVRIDSPVQIGTAAR